MRSSLWICAQGTWHTDAADWEFSVWSPIEGAPPEVLDRARFMSRILGLVRAVFLGHAPEYEQTCHIEEVLLSQEQTQFLLAAIARVGGECYYWAAVAPMMIVRVEGNGDGEGY